MSGAPACVLIGFADALAAPEAIFSLRDAGFQVRVFAREGRAPLAARRLPVGAPIFLPPPEADAASCVAALRAAVAQDPSIRAVMALDDAALWLTDAAFGAAAVEGGPACASAVGAQARFALDKRLQIAAAAAAGIPAPPTRILEGPQDLASVDLFPCIVKSALAAQIRDGGLRRGGAIFAMTRDDLSAKATAGVLYPALAQSLVAGDGEGLFGFATSGGVVGWSAHRRLRMMNPHGSGASACRAIPVDPVLRAAAERMIAALDWRGPFMIELLRDGDGRAWFMEMNGRLWGSTALARRAGLEHPAWAAQQALGSPLDPPPPAVAPTGLEVRHLGRELAHLLFVIKGPESAFHRARWPSLGRSMLGVLRPSPRRAFYNYDKAHPWFFIADAVETLAARMRRR